MKSTIRRSTLFLFLILSITAIKCKKDKNTLPPETQVGNNTFGCLLDGQIFKIKGNGGINPVVSCFYQQIYQGRSGFVFYAEGKKLNNPLTSIGVGFDSLNLKQGKTYDLIELAKGNAYGSYRYAPTETSNIQNYNTSIKNSGELNITKLDEINQIISGIFWFDIVKNNGDTIHITQGRFDMKYTK